MVKLGLLFLKWHIDDFHRYINILEKLLQQNLDGFVKKSEDELKKYTHDPELGIIEDDMSYEYWQLAETFPKILRNSLLITCYSFLEYQLIEICKSQKGKKSLQVDVTDLSGKGVERSRNYLKKVAGIDFAEDVSWSEIRHITLIRNFIVHKNGILDNSENAKKIRAYIDKRSDISLDERNTIILGANYCRHVINILETFLTALLERTLE